MRNVFHVSSHIRWVELKRKNTWRGLQKDLPEYIYHSTTPFFSNSHSTIYLQSLASQSAEGWAGRRTRCRNGKGSPSRASESAAWRIHHPLNELGQMVLKNKMIEFCYLHTSVDSAEVCISYKWLYMNLIFNMSTHTCLQFHREYFVYHIPCNCDMNHFSFFSFFFSFSVCMKIKHNFPPHSHPHAPQTLQHISASGVCKYS